MTGVRLASAALQTDIVTRSFDAAAINAVCNHPDVLPGLSLGLDAIDVTNLIEDPRNIAYLGEHGGAIFHRVGPGVYSAHDFFLPSGRGTWALAASRFMLADVFAGGARMVFAETPADNRACRMFNRWLGFKSEGVSSFPLYAGGDPVEHETFVMERG